MLDTKMPRRTKRLLLLAAGVLWCAFTGWTTVKVMAWVRDLPNRIVTDADAAIASVGVAVTDYYHHCLDSGDSTTRLQVMNEQFLPMIHGHPEVVTWIRNEYRDDIRALIDSDDSTVATAASELLARLDAASESPQP